MDPKELEILLTPPQMSEAEKEIRAWLKSNQKTLAGRTPDEVAELAILVGFDRNWVYSVLSAFRDAMDGSHIDNRAAMHLFTFNHAVKEVSRMKADMAKVKELDLTPLWKDVHAYQTGESA